MWNLSTQFWKQCLAAGWRGSVALLLAVGCPAARASDFPSAPTTAVVPTGAAPKRVLFYCRCVEFEDGMVRRNHGEASMAEKVLGDLGKQYHLVFTCTRDGSGFTRDNLEKYDAFCFFTSGDLTQAGGDGNPPMSAAGKAALLQAIQDGKGFVGIHSAADTFASGAEGVDPYVQMLGGELRVRVRGMGPAHQIVVDTNFPGMQAVPADFATVDEWYTMRNYAANLHVLLIQDTGSMSRGAYYAPDYPSTWARQCGRGRVFYTSMGHQPEEWNSPVFRSILGGGLQWAAGAVPAEVSPNIARVTPGVRMQPPGEPAAAAGPLK